MIRLRALHVDVLDCSRRAALRRHRVGGGGKPRKRRSARALSEDDLYRAYAATDPSLERVTGDTRGRWRTATGRAS